MVKGLELFREWFAPHANQYVLIGGTAASLAMQDAGLPFRATKDLDIVLHVEALTAAFAETFWRFVTAGGYATRQAGTGKPCFYRFRKPGDERFPAMLELFSRAPELDPLRPLGAGHLTPIPFDEAVTSLSAILLDDDYYRFILHGRREVHGLPWVGEDRLIPLKAIAWLELDARSRQGAAIDAKSIRKHAHDILRLSQLLAPATRIELPEKIAGDLRRFLGAAATDASLEPKRLGMEPMTLHEALARVARAYCLE